MGSHIDVNPKALMKRKIDYIKKNLGPISEKFDILNILKNLNIRNDHQLIDVIFTENFYNNQFYLKMSISKIRKEIIQNRGHEAWD